MTSKIIYIDQAESIKGRKVFFDTNIWLLLEGVNGLSGRHRQDQYSQANSILRSNKNDIIVNEHVISELCNRSVKLAYDFAKQASGLGEKFMRFKEFRGTQEFMDALEVARDTCLNILEDCEFCSCYDRYYNIEHVVEEYANGRMDFSDIIIKSHCKIENYLLMSDDRDYLNCDIDIITANKRLLA